MIGTDIAVNARIRTSPPGAGRGKEGIRELKKGDGEESGDAIA